jgi:hypothetical protein
MKRCLLLIVITALAVSTASCKNIPAGYESIFDGKTLNGWRQFAEYIGDAGKWEIKDGAITGRQNPVGKGAYLCTEKAYGDFDVYVEVKADYPIDTGLFLRSQGNILSYQITLDDRPEGEYGAIYSPGGGGFLKHNTEGITLWKRNKYNSVRTRIEGQPAHIQVWINGTKTMDFTDTRKDDNTFRVPEKGLIVLQVHPGDNTPEGNRVYFKNIAIKEL